MSEKQFDHIENRIREAAENSEPPFDEHAWSLMEAKLNKEDNKYRFLFWLVPLLLLTFSAGGYLLFYNGKLSDKKEIANQHITGKQADNLIPPAIIPASPRVQATINTDVDSTGTEKKIDPKSAVITDKLLVEGNSPVNIPLYRSSTKIKSVKKGSLSVNSKGATIDDIEAKNETEQDVKTDDLMKDIASATPADNIAGNNTWLNLIDSLKQTDSLSKPVVKNEPVGKKNTDEKKKSLKVNKASRFYLLGAIGADAGSVRLLSLKDSKITPRYGIGIGYQLDKRISFQTGFYASRKKYIAGPDDYIAKAGSYWSQVKILKVDAACLVYDIPLTVRYNIVQRPSFTYYAATGISSFIMKNEDYDYHYIRNGNYYHAAKAYSGNRHLFSVFNLSAGIEKKLSQVFYIQAEPSVSVPLAGVGEGSVKLYSTALQIGLKYQPLKKRK